MKKFVLVVSIIAMLTLAFPMTALAGETTIISVSNGSHTFDKAWAASKTIKYTSANVPCKLFYEFNTTFINEDCAESYTMGNIHRARIKNNTKTHYGPWAEASEYSNVQVRHAGTKVYYYMGWHTT